jgi:hypothetical protein
MQCYLLVTLRSSMQTAFVTVTVIRNKIFTVWLTQVPLAALPLLHTLSVAQ